MLSLQRLLENTIPHLPAPPRHPTTLLPIDALGRKCPIPFLLRAERIGKGPVGQLVSVRADDPAAQTDVPAWCMLKSQVSIEAADMPGDGWAFLVRRSY